MESTYGNRNHEDRSHSSDKLLKVILETLDIGGTLVIPSFAVGRTQDFYMKSIIIKKKVFWGNIKM
jgi:metallo-beta-lactamase family protein